MVHAHQICRILVAVAQKTEYMLEPKGFSPERLMRATPDLQVEDPGYTVRRYFVDEFHLRQVPVPCLLGLGVRKSSGDYDKDYG